MHPLFPKADRLSGEVIGAAIEARRIMGPGLLESIYELTEPQKLICPVQTSLNRRKRRQRRAEPSLKRRLDKARKSQDRLHNGRRFSPRGPISKNG